MSIKKYILLPNYKYGTSKKRKLSDFEVAQRAENRRKEAEEIKELKELREDRYKASDIYNPWQEAHSPTEDIAGKKSQHFCRRRVQDVRVQDKIDECGGNVAAIRISRAYHHLTHGMGAKISSIYIKKFERCGLENFLNDGEWLDYLIRCVVDYKKWRDLYGNRVNCDAIVNIICDGLSFDAVTKKYHKRNGWAKDNLVEGLDLYNKMKNWEE